MQMERPTSVRRVDAPAANAIRRYDKGPGRSRYSPAEKLTFAQRMRKNPTPSEAILWGYLRAKRLLGVGFLRQRPIFGWIVDFYAPKLGLVVEVDGDIHGTDPIQYSRDRFRDRWMTERGLLVYRIPARAILADPHAIVRQLSAYIRGIGESVHNAKPGPRQGRTLRGQNSRASS
jgi:very-short-patch-repair endonuclease